MLMRNDKYEPNTLMTNNGLMVGDVWQDDIGVDRDRDRERIERGFELARRDANRQWFVLMCRTGSELLIRDELEKREIGVFCPHIEFEKKKVNGSYYVRPDKAVFSGYVFVNVAFDGDIFQALKSLDDCYGMMRRDEYVLRVPISNILIMMRKFENGDYGKRVDVGAFHWVHHGLKVKILDGVYYGQTGIVNRVTNEDVELNITMMGKTSMKTFRLDMIERAD